MTVTSPVKADLRLCSAMLNLTAACIRRAISIFCWSTSVEINMSLNKSVLPFLQLTPTEH